MSLVTAMDTDGSLILEGKSQYLSGSTDVMLCARALNVARHWLSGVTWAFWKL